MRRFRAYEFKISIFILIVASFIIPANIINNGTSIVYNFGFPCDYWSIYQGNEGSYQLFNNIFNGNRGMNINIIGLFINLVVIYGLVMLLKKIYIRVIKN